MLKAADNELLTRVGPGTPMGNLLRRFWLPVATSTDVGAPDDEPVRMRILHENLIAFRDTHGEVGVLSAYCPHRRALLFWGRNEEAGLRCAYHGWKFDVRGQCVDMPTEPPGSTFKDKLKAIAYPTVERGGLVWIYMGPPDKQPQFPEYPWLDLPEENRVTRTAFTECNYLQGLEGDVDTAHISYLHNTVHLEDKPDHSGFFADGFREYAYYDRSPKLTVKQTDYGFLYGGRRTLDGTRFYWRMTHWVAPTTTFLPGEGVRTAKLITPIDDYNCLSVFIAWGPDSSIVQRRLVGRQQSTRSNLQTVELSDRYLIDVVRSDRHRYNDYGIDRDFQRTTKFSGIDAAPPDEDRAVTETMDPILERSQEHLGVSDVAVVAMRRALLRMTRDLETGNEPVLTARPELYRLRGFDVFTDHDDFEKVIADCQDELTATAP